MKKNVVIKISGMHCENCSTKIKKAVEKLDVESIDVSYEKGIMTALAENPDIIIDKIKDLGYEGKVDFLNENKNYKKIIVASLVLLGFYLIIKSTVGFSFMPQLQEEASYSILFLLGLITSLHCLSMCGGIVLSQSVSFKNPIKASLTYNIGRVLAYTTVGGIVGGLGSVISFSPLLKGYITIFAGGFMMLLGLSMLNSFSFLRRFIKFPKIFKVSGIEYSQNTPFFIGLATGLMPCGPLQTMQLYALGTGSVMKGALSMFIFSVGTVPLMMGFGTLSGYISHVLNRKLLKASGILVVILGLIMIDRGLALQGRTTISTFNPKVSVTEAMFPEKINGFQVIRISANEEGYQPNFFILEKGVTVKWMIKGEVINSCNNEIVIPTLGISQQLQEGHNLLEFTPLEEGELEFSCWRGTLRGAFMVVEDLDNVPDKIRTIPARTTECCTR